VTQKRLSELEQLVMDYVWAHPGCSVTACQEALAASRPLKESTVRTLFQRLEQKGYVTHEADGRTYLYRAVQPRSNIAATAVKQIIDRFCGGSLEELLVGMVHNDIVDRKELQELARKINAKKQERAK
jgi:predicted transcriptional regulator